VSETHPLSERPVKRGLQRKSIAVQAEVQAGRESRVAGERCRVCGEKSRAETQNPENPEKSRTAVKDSRMKPHPETREILEKSRENPSSAAIPRRVAGMCRTCAGEIPPRNRQSHPGRTASSQVAVSPPSPRNGGSGRNPPFQKHLQKPLQRQAPSE